MSLTFTWSLVPNTHGWAECVIADDHAELTTYASYATTAPEDLMAAVAQLFGDAAEASVRYADEPAFHRWDLHRDGDQVHIRVARFLESLYTGGTGDEVWSSTQALDVLARAIVEAFDEVHRVHGTSGYQRTWGRPFPHFELDLLRMALRHGAPPPSRTPRRRL